MRVERELWSGRERVQWACALMELLGHRDLGRVPLLMAGLRGVQESAELSDFSLAVRNAREVIPHYTTRRSVWQAASEYGEHVFETGREGSYEVDPESLAFERVNRILDPDVDAAKEALLKGFLPEKRKKRLADPRLPMSVRSSRESGEPPIPLAPLRFPLPDSPAHDLTREPAGPIEVPLTKLRALAEELDEDDARHPDREPGNWQGRLRSRLLRPREDGLGEADVLTLDGIKHLIGLPGSGKTTLLVLLSLYLARQGYRAALFFTSIEVARQYMEVLDRYGTRVGMLVGQNPLTRRRHAERIAENVAAQGDGGFGRNAFGADLFADNCVLSAYAAEGAVDWNHADPPCERVLQRPQGSRRLEEHLCPLWSVCGRNKGPRDLTSADVWVGHVISMDTSVPQHALEERLRYFELIARTFDVVVFDECDMTQKVLDEHGAAILNLSGSEGSVHEMTEDQVLRRLAGRENHRLFDAGNVTYARHLAEFGTHNHALVHAVHKVDEGVSDRYEGQLLTTSRIISEMVGGGEPEALASSQEGHDGVRRRSLERAGVEALWELWDSSIYSAFFDRNGVRDEGWPNAGSCARALGMDPGGLRKTWSALTGYFRRYLAADTMLARREIVADVERVFLGVAFREREKRPRDATDTVRLLVAVSFMILAYRRIVFGARELVLQGFLRDPVASVAASPTLQRVVPLSLLGALSGVRYQFGKTGYASGRARPVELGYVVVNGAPRVLMHRFHELYGSGARGPNVLLTSATSYLEASPTYHVAQGPHYVLSPEEQEHDVVNSVYTFRPSYDAAGRALRFSGGGRLALRNLEQMLESLVSGGTEDSEIYQQIASFDVQEDIRRKAAIVVNSYEQVRRLKTYLDRRHPAVGARTVGVVSGLREGERHEDFVTPAQVGKLGDDPNSDIVIFPMLAIGRGVNIVFTRGPRKRQAAIGTVYFLTRPHPSGDDLGLLLGLAARDTQALDRHEFPPGAGLKEMDIERQGRKDQTFRSAARLLQEPLMASRLTPTLFKAFTADQMVPIIQTIGRAMRGGRPASVFFVDAAWAPHSARQETDGPRDSMLVMMRAVLERCVRHDDPAVRETYRELYRAFLEPLRRVENLQSPASFEGHTDEQGGDGEAESLRPATYLLEDHEDTDALRPEEGLLVPDHAEANDA